MMFHVHSWTVRCSEVGCYEDYTYQYHASEKQPEETRPKAEQFFVLHRRWGQWDGEWYCPEHLQEREAAEAMVRSVVFEGAYADYIRLKVEGCARCGRDHEIVFQTFKGDEFPVVLGGQEYTHWGFCENTREPVLMRFEEKDLGEEDGVEIVPDPCPFCKGEWRYGGVALREVYGDDGESSYFSVVCNSCHASSGRYPTQTKAVGAWNRRPKEKALEEKVAEAWEMLNTIHRRAGRRLHELRPGWVHVGPVEDTLNAFEAFAADLAGTWCDVREELPQTDERVLGLLGKANDEGEIESWEIRLGTFYAYDLWSWDGIPAPEEGTAVILWQRINRPPQKRIARLRWPWPNEEEA